MDSQRWIGQDWWFYINYICVIRKNNKTLVYEYSNNSIFFWFLNFNAHRACCFAFSNLIRRSYGWYIVSYEIFDKISYYINVDKRQICWIVIYFGDAVNTKERMKKPHQTRTKRKRKRVWQHLTLDKTDICIFIYAHCIILVVWLVETCSRTSASSGSSNSNRDNSHATPQTDRRCKDSSLMCLEIYIHISNKQQYVLIDVANASA